MTWCPWCYTPGAAVFTVSLDPGSGAVRPVAECAACLRHGYGRWEEAPVDLAARRVACFLPDHGQCPPEWSEVG